MSAKKKKPRKSPRAPGARTGHARQRQHLIDACISALHLHGPSRTTVQKVVAIANMSPGIVRFYFDSKAAMLVASLQFLAADFDERVAVPVAALKATPVAALETLVERYLDADIASPRKVSVWYAFWGEASSRQEYYEICGQKDESFAVLVRELIDALITRSGRTELDADGVALGLIGALEISWQDIAFQEERNLDRPAAKRRCLSLLGSIFPGLFGTTSAAMPRPAEARPQTGIYAASNLFTAERNAVLMPAWAIAGHESQLPRAGDFFTVDVGTERALVIRDGTGVIRALRNNCTESPHALVTDPSGRFEHGIKCRLHRIGFDLDGHGAVPDGRNLSELELRVICGLLFIRAPQGRTAAGTDRVPTRFDIPLPRELMLLAPPCDRAVEADWKVMVEQWLEGAHALVPVPGPDMLGWSMPALESSGWSSRHYLRLVDCVAEVPWQCRFIAPNQLVETRPDGVSVVQVLASGQGRCRLRRLDYTRLPPGGGARAALYLAGRLGRYTRRVAWEAAESIQSGLVQFGYQGAAEAPPAVVWFRRFLAARVPEVVLDRSPTGA